MAKPMPSVEVLLVGLLVLKRREPWLLILAFRRFVGTGLILVGSLLDR
jgi:hypothetical protein